MASKGIQRSMNNKRREIIMEELHREAEELGCIVREVEEQVIRSIEARKEIDEKVNAWLKEAQNMSTNVKNNWLVDGKAKSSKLAKSLLFRNKTSKKSKEDILKMRTHVSRCVSEGKIILEDCFPLEAKGIELVWREGFVEFKSREKAWDKIMEAFKDEKIGMIGLLGMGGIGKTKLVVEMGMKAKEAKLFDGVIMAIVSSELNIKEVQGTLADMLGLELEQETESSRADKLRERIKRVKRILVILDDVWQKVDLESIGIPSQSDHEGCKILLTTRSEKVFEDMGCTLAVRLDVLKEIEAMNLFLNYADITGKAVKAIKRIVRECAGLPLAIITVASALRAKSSEEYEDAAQLLSNSSFADIESADRNVYACLKLSYDYLEDQETQKCFLLCSTYPTYRNARVEELTRYAYGLGMFQNHDSIDQVRQKVHAFIKKLEKAHLLSYLEEDSKYGPSKEDMVCVNMHDVVRDVALWITKKTGPYVVPTSVKEFNRKKMLENAFIIFLDPLLWYGQLPDELDSPKLKMLILLPVKVYTITKDEFNLQYREELQSSSSALQRHEVYGDDNPRQSSGPSTFLVRQVLHVPPVTVAENFFRKTTTLQVLDFESSSPVLLHYLVNLKTLHFRGQDLRFNDMSTIGKLKKLEILKLCFIGDSKALPEWIGELHNLRLLDLSEWHMLEEIPPNVLSGLAKLEELYTPLRHFTTWSDSFLRDLIKLPNLNTFYTLLNSVLSLPKDFTFPELQRYCILGRYPQRLSPWKRAMTLDGLNDLSINMLGRLFPNVEGLRIMVTEPNKCMRLDNIFPDVVPFAPQLIELQIWQYHALKYVFQLKADACQDTKLQLLAPKFMILYHVQKLRKIWKIPHIRENDELVADKEVCTSVCESVLESLFSLVEVQICHCHQLTEIFPNVELIIDRKLEGRSSNLVDIKLECLPKLKYIWKLCPQQNGYLQRLKSIYLTGCHRLTHLFTSTLAESLVNLLELHISDCLALQTIIMQEDNDQDDVRLKNLQHSTSQKGFQQIKSLYIKSCPRLRSVLPMDVVAEGLPKLESICISECAMLGQLFRHSKEKAVYGAGEIAMKNLQSLKLEYVPRLVRLLPVNWHLSLSSLSQLVVTAFENQFAKIQGAIEEEDEEEVEDVDKGEEGDDDGAEKQPCTLEEIYVWQEEDLNFSAGVFPIKAVQSLLNIRVVEIIGKCMLGAEELFDVELAEEPVLTRLEVLKVCYMIKLKHFWKAPAMLINLVSLREICVAYCMAIKILFPMSVVRNLPCLVLLSVSYCPNIQHIFRDNEIGSETKNRSLNDNEEVDVTGDEETCLPNLKVLSVSNCYSLISLFPVSIAQCLAKLDKVCIEGAPQLKLLFYEDGQGHFSGKCQQVLRKSTPLPQLGNLRNLKLTNTKGLVKSLFTRNIVEALCLLEKLEITNCKGLENLIEPAGERISSGSVTTTSISTSSALCFPHLQLLLLLGCERLKNIFPLSIAHCLPSLQKVVICEAYHLEQLFFEDREERQVGCKLIQLPELQILHLEELPSFSKICPSGYALTCLLTASGLQNHKPRHHVHVPCVSATNCNIQAVLDLDEVVVSQDQQYFFLHAQDLTLSHLPNLACIWKGPTDLINLSCLKQLSLTHCRTMQMKSLFTRTMAQTLHSVEFIEIIGCKEVENLFEPVAARDQEANLLRDGKGRSSVACFPRLINLTVHGCDKFRTVFPLSIARNLPELRYLYVNGCFELEDIFTEDQNDEEDGRCYKLIKLPELLKLTLAQLPCLFRICPSGYAVCCQTPLEELKIGGCPLLDSTNCFPPIYKSATVQRHSLAIT